MPVDLLTLMLLHGSPGNTLVTTRPSPRVVRRITSDETPAVHAPRHWFRESLPTSTSGQYRVIEPLPDLVRAAFSHVESMAVLPGDPEADKIVERLIQRRTEAKRPLRRK